MAIKIALGVVAGLLVIALGLAVVLYALTFHPKDEQDEPVVCSAAAPLLSLSATGERPLKVMSWNIQYLAGKEFVFFYDLPDDYPFPPGFAPVERPTATALAATLAEVARVIRDEAPDVVLLQEVDCGARRSDHTDQVALLLAELEGRFPCHAATYYWKAAYVPHPRIRGRVGMKLAVLSRYKLGRAVRHALAPITTDDVVTRQFNLKRAILEVVLPTTEGREVSILNVHLSAFSRGSDTLARQTAQVLRALDRATAAGRPFVLGGDFNLLPSAAAYDAMPTARRYEYDRETHMGPFFARFAGVPPVATAEGPERAAAFTHVLNEPTPYGPDRTIDYVFVSPDATIMDYRVRQADTGAISDHFPVVATVSFAAKPPP